MGPAWVYLGIGSDRLSGLQQRDRLKSAFSVGIMPVDPLEALLD